MHQRVGRNLEWQCIGSYTALLTYIDGSILVHYSATSSTTCISMPLSEGLKTGFSLQLQCLVLRMLALQNNLLRCLGDVMGTEMLLAQPKREHLNRD